MNPFEKLSFYLLPKFVSTKAITVLLTGIADVLNKVVPTTLMQTCCSNECQKVHNIRLQ